MMFPFSVKVCVRHWCHKGSSWRFLSRDALDTCGPWVYKAPGSVIKSRPISPGALELVLPVLQPPAFPEVLCLWMPTPSWLRRGSLGLYSFPPQRKIATAPFPFRVCLLKEKEMEELGAVTKILLAAGHPVSSRLIYLNAYLCKRVVFQISCDFF